MKTFFGMFFSKPTEKSAHFKTLKAAYVSTWVIAGDSQSAESAAIKYINSQGWEVISLEEIVRETSEEDCPSQEAKLQFQKAQIYGVAAIFAASGVDTTGKDYSFN